MPVNDETLRRTVAELLSTRVVSRDALVNELVARKVDLGHDDRRLARLLQMDTTFAELGDGVFHVPSLLEGTSWTVWVDGDDAREGFVRMHPHLSPLGWWLIGDEVELLDQSGEAVGTLETDGLRLDGRDTDVVRDRRAGSGTSPAAGRRLTSWAARSAGQRARRRPSRPRPK